MWWKIGVRYSHGKILIYKADSQGGFSKNPGQPNWAVDIREIIAMVFAGTGGLMLIYMNQIDYAMIIMVGLLMYATGRTVPGGKPQIRHDELKQLVQELIVELKKEKE